MASNDIDLRRATLADAPLLSEIGSDTFVRAFGHLYPPEDLTAFLEGTHGVASWERKLRNPDAAAWIALDAAGKPIGYASAGHCKLPVENLDPRAGELYQLYLLPEAQSMKLGPRLIERAFEWLGARGYAPLYIGVWSQNTGAQRFYARYGFKQVGEYEFPVGTRRDHEFILCRV